MENTAGQPEVLYSRQRRITRDGLDHVNMPDFSFANSVAHRRVGRVESPIERAKQRSANFLGHLVAVGGVGAIFRYGFLAEDRFSRLQSLDNDILVGESRRCDDDRVDAT